MGRIQTLETKEKIRRSLTKYNPPFVRKCPSCNNEVVYTCREHVRRADRNNHICVKCKQEKEKSSNHHSLMGRKSVVSQNRRSKNEVRFASLCQTKFEGVKTNEDLFNGWDADVILTNHKIAVLWNGVWHRKKITKKHSVFQVKNRDKIKLKEIISCGYTPYVIEDDGKENTDDT